MAPPLSNTLLGILNTITALLSLPLIGAGIWLAIKRSSECTRVLQWVAIGLGVFILIVSLAGLFGSCCGRSKCLLFLYLLVVLLIILALLAFTIFAVVLLNKGAGHAVSGKGFDEYRLGDYSTWLQRKIVNKTAYWNKIKSCLIHSKVCKSLQEDTHIATVSSFYQQSLSPIESGCCKPPLACNFTYVNATFWKDATNTTADSDCTQWNNNPNILCFNCQSCKAGVLQDAKDNWKKLVITNAAIIVFLILVFTLGCCAMANSRRRRVLQPTGFYVKA